jgi:hypothetical protein
MLSPFSQADIYCTHPRKVRVGQEIVTGLAFDTGSILPSRKM